MLLITFTLLGKYNPIITSLILSNEGELIVVTGASNFTTHFPPV